MISKLPSIITTLAFLFIAIQFVRLLSTIFFFINSKEVPSQSLIVVLRPTSLANAKPRIPDAEGRQDKCIQDHLLKNTLLLQLRRPGLLSLQDYRILQLMMAENLSSRQGWELRPCCAFCDNFCEHGDCHI